MQPVPAWAGAAPDPDIDAVAAVAAAMDDAFYRREAGIDAEIDAARHFHAAGWRLGLDPSPWFDTRFYLATYPDIAAAGIDPFVHWLAFGAAEGRLPRPVEAARARVLAACQAPGDRRPGYDAPEDAPVLTAETLRAAVRQAVAGAAALVVSASHDRYCDVTGGMQVLIGDEQALFAAGMAAYLHVSPAVSRLTLGDASQVLQVVLDGRFLGLVGESELAGVLAGVHAEAGPGLRRLLVVHSVFGHRVDALLALHAAWQPQDSFFWLHDYASLCEGFNLLRNDLDPCGAPPAGSMACRVCVYGAGRTAYLAELHRLFAGIGFHVLAPSQAALATWLRATTLPWRSARVHDNASLVATDAAPAAAGPGPVRVAFAGYGLPHKGWPLFLELLQAMRGRQDHCFYHFAVPGALAALDQVTPVAVQVGPDDRDAMVAALRAHRIDLLLVLSPWPETFSYVAHEGLAAGAALVALADGGNVAELVRGHAAGAVLDGPAALLGFFTSGAALALARKPRPPQAALRATGTTATLDPAWLGPSGPARGRCPDHGLVLLADGAPLTLQPHGGALRAALPDGTRRLRLRSRRRFDAVAVGERAGLALTRLLLDGAPVPPGHARLLSGWLPAPDGELLTDGDAVLDPGGAALLELAVPPGLTYWRPPVLPAAS